MKSHLLDIFMARRLHSFLPATIQMEGLKLKFSTYSHGWNLSTLYAMVENFYPCLILFKTVELEAVFGVYISCNISPPSNQIRGDGGCFVFRLDGPNGACYRWPFLNTSHQGLSGGVERGPISATLQVPSIISISPNVPTPSQAEDTITPPISPEIILPNSPYIPPSQPSSDMTSPPLPPPLSTSPSSQSPAATIALSSQTLQMKTVKLLEPSVFLSSLTFHQFALCSYDYMAFGGSSIHGTNAIRISSDLMSCSSGHSDTYNNPALVPDEPDDPFYIADIEVFCGEHKIQKKQNSS